VSFGDYWISTSRYRNGAPAIIFRKGRGCLGVWDRHRTGITV